MLKRNDIVERLAQKGYTKKSANYIIDDFIRTIAEALVEGEDVQFHGFGTFYVKEMAPRKSTDLNSQETILIPGHKTPKFSASTPLRRWVREGIIRE